MNASYSGVCSIVDSCLTGVFNLLPLGGMVGDRRSPDVALGMGVDMGCGYGS